jgi:hypothetical protein
VGFKRGFSITPNQRPPRQQKFESTLKETVCVNADRMDGNMRNSEFLRSMAIVMILAMSLMIAGCSNQKIVSPNSENVVGGQIEKSEQGPITAQSPKDNAPDLNIVGSRVTDLVKFGSADSTDLPGIASITYAYGVVPWYDRNHGDTDHMVIFYLSRQPSVVNFYGQSAYYGWLNLNGNAQLYDSRWTSSGFRVMILIGATVTDFWGFACGTSPSHYRLSY